MQKFFAIEMSAVRFVRNTFIFSLLALVPPLLAFVALTPRFGAMLAGGGPPLERFMRQVVTNGLPVVFAVNYVSFFLYAWIVSKPDQRYGFKLVLLVDMPVRVVGFIALHALIYVLSADWFGSFWGKPRDCTSGRGTDIDAFGPFREHLRRLSLCNAGERLAALCHRDREFSQARRVGAESCRPVEICGCRGADVRAFRPGADRIGRLYSRAPGMKRSPVVAGTMSFPVRPLSVCRRTGKYQWSCAACRGASHRDR